MNTAQRIVRGFRRLGIALSIPFFVFAAGFLSIGIYQDYQRANNEWKEFPTQKPSSATERGPWEQYQSDKKPNYFDRFDKDNPSSDLIPEKSRLQEISMISAGVAGLGVAAFLSMWLLGWVIAGFTKD